MADDPQVYDADASFYDGDDAAPSGASGATTALAPVASQSLTTSAQDYTRAQLDLIKQTVAAGTSDLEFRLFIEVCKLTRLNPFARQIYAIMRNAGKDDDGKLVKRMTIQTGIDGYLAIASRTGEFAGMDDVEFDTEQGDHPTWARVTVYRLVQGQRMPFTATARWREYVQTKDVWVNNKKTGEKVPTEMWARMGWTMLGKCSRALALRLAFPAELGGVYTHEEMAQADNDFSSVPAVPAAAQAQPARPAPRPAPQRAAKPAQQRTPAPAADMEQLPTWGALGALAKSLDMGADDWHDTITRVTGKRRYEDQATHKIVTIAEQLTDDDKRKMVDWLEKRRQTLEDADATTPPLETLAFAGA